MTGSSIVVENQKIAELLNRLLQDCGRDTLRAVPPGQESAQGLLLADCAEVLRLARDFPACLAANPLRQDARLAGKKLTTYSLQNDAADYTARGLHTTAEGYTAFEIVGVGCIGRVRLRRPPRGEEETILAAASAAVVCGAPFAQVLASLQRIF